MLGSQITLQAAAEALRKTGDLKAFLLDATSALGFNTFSYGRRTALPYASRQISIITNYPSAWQERYTQAQYIKHDPSISASSKTIRPIVWSDELFKATPDLWNEAQNFGLKVGCAQFLIDGSGDCGMLTLARDHEPITFSEMQAKEEHIHWLTVLTHENHPSSPNKLHTSRIVLTPREIEILQWTADGKTAKEIAQILPLSIHTVNFYFKSVMRKLDAPNKTTAVLRAAMYGLLNY